MPNKRFDTIILGQGLAGSALAWHLAEAGQRICVIDNNHASSSSRVSPGLINPLAGMRFNRRPEMSDWLSAADSWYARLNKVFGQILFHPMPMLRLFRSTEQRRFHERRRQDPVSRDLLDDGFGPENCPEPIAAPHGGFIQHRTGYADLPLLLDLVRNWLRERDALLERDIDYAQIEIGEDHVAFSDLHADRLVCCEGARLSENPWFDHLPLARGKGEILNLRIEGWQPRRIINGAHWLVPLSNGEMRFGATHEHKQIDQDTSAAGREELLAGVKAMLGRPAEVRVNGHQAGIRPGTSDRYPLLGRHPAHPSLWVCNGFGARGALSIPWYTRCLSEHILHDCALPTEADIRRFK